MLISFRVNGGRIGTKRYRRKVAVFESKVDAVAYVGKLEQVRRKHHYQMADAQI